jgi:hypothetical protein
MENFSEPKIRIAIDFFSMKAKINALVSSLSEQQHVRYQAELKKRKDTFIEQHPSLSEEHRKALDKLLFG